MSGGSLEKLTRAVTYWRYICFLRFRGFFRGVPGFLGGVPGFSGVPECSVMFRCSGVPCSGVPGSPTCPNRLSAIFFTLMFKFGASPVFP